MRSLAGLEKALARLRAEYRDLPGLALTPEQAECPCHGDDAASTRALEELVRHCVLTRRDDGPFVLSETHTRA